MRQGNAGRLTEFGTGAACFALWAALGCGGDERRSDGLEVDADADAEVEGGTSAEVDASPVCGEVTLSMSGNPWPGEELRLEIRGADFAAWKMEGGSWIQPEGLVVTWALREDSALHEAEVARVWVAAVRPGCETVAITREVVVDWPESRRTLVLMNPSVPGSEAVAAAYAESRGIPPGQLCAVASGDRDELDGADYPRWLGEVMACVDRVGPRVHVIVPVYGVPYKVRGRIADLVSPANKVTSSLDALLAYGRASVGFGLHAQNPYYQSGDSRTGEYRPYLPFGRLRKSRGEYFLVGRIDGADAAAALALIERTREAEALARAGALAGKVYVDGNRGLPHPETDNFGSYEAGEWNIIGVGRVFASDGRYEVVQDFNAEEFGTAPAPLVAPEALYYAGWYSFGNYNDVFAWQPGAIGGHLDSCSACDLRGERDWSAMALRRGITATFGAVNEPYVAGMPEYDQLFAYLLQGASYGEAAAESTKLGAWMMVWIGDPLYRPYGHEVSVSGARRR